MKTRAPRHQTSVRPAKSNRAKSTGNGQPGNGHLTSSASSAIKQWLSRPKQNFINNKWASAVSGKTFDVFNPADGSVIARVPHSDKEDIDSAVNAARNAFERGPWRRMTPSERGKIIWRI